MKNIYYLCSHEKGYITKDNRSNNTICFICRSHTYIFNFLIRHKIAGFYPKSLSAMKRAGNNNAACR